MIGSMEFRGLRDMNQVQLNLSSVGKGIKISNAGVKNAIKRGLKRGYKAYKIRRTWLK